LELLRGDNLNIAQLPACGKIKELQAWNFRSCCVRALLKG